MFTPEDLDLFAEKGIDVHKVEEQLASFKSGFPFLRILSSASVGNGILSLDEQQTQYYLDLWEGYLKDNHKVVNHKLISKRNFSIRSNILLFTPILTKPV